MNGKIYLYNMQLKEQFNWILIVIIIIIIQQQQKMLNVLARDLKMNSTTTTTTTTTTSNSNIKVYSSEATLLTRDPLMSAYKIEEEEKQKINKTVYQNISLKSRCTRDMFVINFMFDRPFRGMIYAKDFPMECNARGNNYNKNLTLNLPTSGCGVRAEALNNGDMELMVYIMLQSEQKLRQSTDLLRKLSCRLSAKEMTMHIGRPVRRTIEKFDSTVAASENVLKQLKSNEQRIGKKVNLYKLATTPHVRIWLELLGLNKSGIVEVGQATTLSVHAIVPGTMGVRVVDCVALDGLGESVQQLLDNNGCPIDEHVMFALNHKVIPLEEGWSKRIDEDPVEQVFSTTFPAFKFPDRERLHVSCGVVLCKASCANFECQQSLNSGILRTDQQLARIEVFNSLAVIAPQIEIDRLRYERRFNMSSDNYSHTYSKQQVYSEGILCLSISKLAISFCILGGIFLIAVFVAIISLLRVHKKDPHYYQGEGSGGILSSTMSDRVLNTELSTSMLSSSNESEQSARFGHNLFMAYYTQTLPYGRVY